MKSLKVLGLAAIAAMAVMAFGAGSASALTKLCATGTPNVGACPANKTEYSGHIETKLTPGTSATLTTSITNLHCEESATTLTADTSTNVPPATTVTGSVTAFTLGKCKTTAGQACTATAEGLPYVAHFEGTVEGLTNTSSLRITGKKFKTVCGFIINCTFSTAEEVLHGHNISSPRTTTEWTVNKVPLARAGGLCPATAELDASYEVTTPAGFTVH